MTTISITYDRATICQFHADGRLSINNNPEELDQQHSPHFQGFLERKYKIHNFRILPKNRIVTEGRTLQTQNGIEWEIYVGRPLSSNQKNRAWLAYRERVIDAVALPNQDSLSLLSEACITLKTNFNTTVQLTASTASSHELLENAKQIEKHVYSLFIAQVEKQRTFIIRDGSYNPHLDQVARSCTTVYANIYDAAKDVDSDVRREAIYGLQGTQRGHEVTWAWLIHLVETDRVEEAIDQLYKLTPTLLETEATHLFCKALGSKITSWQLSSFTFKRHSGPLLARIMDLVCGHAALLALKRGSPDTTIMEYLHTRNVEAAVAIEIADHFMANGDLLRVSMVMCAVVRSIEIQKWFVKIANQLWAENKYKQALDWIWQIRQHIHYGVAEELWLIERENELWIIDEWYLSTAEKLWKDGEVYRAVEVLKGVRTVEEKEQWLIDKANELFDEGDVSEAAKIIAENYSNSSSKENWFREKADILLKKGKVGRACKMITYSKNAGLIQAWCLSKADQLLEIGKLADAVRFIEYGPLEDKEKGEWFSAKKISREPKTIHRHLYSGSPGKE